MSQSRRWTAAEDAVVRENYAAIGAVGCAGMLPGHTVPAIRAHARRMGVACENATSGPAWTPVEDRALRTMARLGLSSHEMAGSGALPGRSESSVRNHLSKLGIRLSERDEGAVTDAGGLLVLPPARHLWTAMEDRLLLAAMELRPGGLTPHQCDALAAIVSVGGVRVNRHDVAARVAELYERMGTGTEVAA